MSKASQREISAIAQGKADAHACKAHWVEANRHGKSEYGYLHRRRWYSDNNISSHYNYGWYQVMNDLTT